MFARAVPIEFHAIVVGVAEVDRFADAVVGSAFQFHTGSQNAADGLGELRAFVKEDSEVIQAGGAGRRRRTAEAFPGVETDVMMIAVVGEESRLRTKALRELEAEHIAIKRNCAFEVGNF